MRFREAIRDYSEGIFLATEAAIINVGIAIAMIVTPFLLVLLFGVLFYTSILAITIVLVMFAISPQTVEKLAEKYVLPRVRRQVRKLKSRYT